MDGALAPQISKLYHNHKTIGNSVPPSPKPMQGVVHGRRDSKSLPPWKLQVWTFFLEGCRRGRDLFLRRSVTGETQHRACTSRTTQPLQSRSASFPSLLSRLIQALLHIDAGQRGAKISDRIAQTHRSAAATGQTHQLVIVPPKRVHQQRRKNTPLISFFH